jgi:hypothetical protein
MAPDFGGHEEETEPRRRQSRVSQLGDIVLWLAVEQHQPTVQVSCRVPDYADCSSDTAAGGARVIF